MKRDRMNGKRIPVALRSGESHVWIYLRADSSRSRPSSRGQSAQDSAKTKQSAAKDRFLQELDKSKRLLAETAVR